MSLTFTIIAAFLAAIVACLIIGFVLSCILKAAFGDISTWANRWRLNRRQLVLNQIDSLFNSGQFEQADSVLRQAFMLDIVKKNSSLIDQIHDFHVAVLNRVINISEKHGRHIPNLAIVEDLLQNRAMLMKSYVELASARRSASGTLRKTGTRPLPGWAKAEFEKKRDDLLDRLQTNRRSLEAQIDEMVSSLRNISREQDIQFH